MVTDLRERLRGALLVPGDAGYHEARSIWNAMIDRRPAAIARCLGVADVVASVDFAREHGLTISIKGGGHNISGLAVCEGGLMLDMSLMRGVWVDPAARRARAQAGCLIGDVDRETQLHGLAAVLGFVSTTGVAGLTLAGGFGYLTRQHGWSSDNVRSIDLVTADGRVVRASAGENPDLFWGVRGAGANFGVATSFEYALHPVGPDIIAGAIAWRGERAAQVLEMYRAVTAEAPPELTVVAALRLAPPAPWLPQAIHGKPIVALFVCCTGPRSVSEQLVARIKSFGAPVADIVQRRSYLSQQCLVDVTQPKGRRYYWKSEYLPRYESELHARVIDQAGCLVSPHSMIVMFPLDGALNRLRDDYSAAGNRDAAAVLNIMASWDKPEDDQANIEWARSAWRELRHFSTGGTYVNFLTEEEGAERIQAAYGPNLVRLAALKAKWDPANFFRMNKNIAPQPI